MRRQLLLFTIALASQAAQAQYKCAQAGGGVSFQQTPCATSDKQQKLTLRDADTAASGAAASDATAKGTVEQRMVASMERERRVREIQQQITDIENDIASRNDRMTREMAALRSRKAQAANNLAGATYEQSVSTEMQAVAQKYQALNDVDLARLKTLRSSLAEAKAIAKQ